MRPRNTHRPTGGDTPRARLSQLIPVLLIIAGAGLAVGCSGGSSTSTDNPRDTAPTPVDHRVTRFDNGDRTDEDGRSVGTRPQLPVRAPVDEDASTRTTGRTEADGHQEQIFPDEASRAVDDALARYDAVVTVLAADPVSALAPDSPPRVLWDTIVAPGSFLHDDVIERLVTEPAASGTRLLPGPDGVGYRHHRTRVTGTDADIVEFEWCGYSPGIRIESSTGRILDDYVAVMSGSGRIVRSVTPQGPPGPHPPSPSNPDDHSTTTWLLDELNHFDHYVLPPGSTDPCVGQETTR